MVGGTEAGASDLADRQDDPTEEAVEQDRCIDVSGIEVAAFKKMVATLSEAWGVTIECAALNGDDHHEVTYIAVTPCEGNSGGMVAFKITKLDWSEVSPGKVAWVLDAYTYPWPEHPAAGATDNLGGDFDTLEMLFEEMARQVLDPLAIPAADTMGLMVFMRDDGEFHFDDGPVSAMPAYEFGAVFSFGYVGHSSVHCDEDGWRGRVKGGLMRGLGPASATIPEAVAAAWDIERSLRRQASQEAA